MKKLSLLILFIIINPLVIFSQNNALEFDGTDDYVNCGTLSTLRPTSAITIEAWVNINSIDQWEGILSNMQDNGSDESGYAFYFNNGNITWWLKTVNGSANFENNAPNAPINTGSWNHIAGTYDGNYLRLYVNGIYIDDYATTGNIDWTNSPLGFYIGALKDNDENYYFDGQIDDVRIWNDARTETEIRQNMYKELIGNESGLVAYYKFNETSGTSLADSKGSNTGTLTNMTGNEWLTSSAMFGPKNCLDFDGSNDYVYTDLTSTSSSILTIEFMVYFKSLTNQQNLLHINDGGINRRIVPYKDASNQINLFAADASNNADVVNGNYYVDNQKWYHLAFVYNNQVATIYVNGELTATKTMAYSYSLNGIDRLYLAADFGYGSPSNIKLDEVRIWNTARTATEIRENMYKSLTGNESGLVAYYNFDNNSGSTLQDFSGNGNDGILTNMDNSDWVSSSAFNTWLNTSSSSWATISNWSQGATPLSTDNVGIYSLSGSDPIIIGTPTVNNMYIGNGATVTVSSNFTVNNNLLLDEDLNINGNIVNIGSDGKLIENNGLLCGCSGYSCHTQTLDNISCLNIAGLGAEITTTANMGSTDVYRYQTAITGPTGDKGINRFYKILPTTNTGLNATLVFHYDDSELNGCTESNLVLFKSTNNGQTWSQVGGTINTTDNTITLTSIDGFSWWTAAEGGSTLPIELISFNGIYIKEQIELNWQTVSEMNNEAFIIERSEYGTDFSKIAEIPGSANSNEIVKYNYNDLNVERNKIYYYKLSDRSFNGNVKERKTIYVSTGIKNDNISYQVFPNPFNDNLNIIINGKHDYIKIKLLNSSGLEVANIFEGKTTKNGRHISWNCFDKNQQKIAKGIYFLEIETNGGIKTEKLILQ